METLLKIKIKNSGYKHNFLAEKIGITPVYFSMCLNGIRELDRLKQAKLKEVLK